MPAKKTTEQPATNGHEPELVLDLDALLDPPGKLTYLGKAYAFRPWGMKSYFERREIGKDWARILDIEAQETVSEEDGTEHDTLLRSLLRRIADVDDIADTIPIDLAAEAALRFFVHRADAQIRKGEAMTKSMSSTGAPSASGSTDSGPSPEGSTIG